MANKHRGEIEAELGGVRRRLVLTLGALADLEAAFGAEDLGALADRFASGKLRARDLACIIAVGLRGAGECVTEAEAAAMTTEDGALGFVRICAALINATFADASEPALPPPGPRTPGDPAPRRSPGTG